MLFRVRNWCSASSRLTFIESAAGAAHFFHDVSRAGSPDERFWAFVMAVDIGADGYDEFFQVAEYAAPEPALSEVAKEAFHHIQPRRAGGALAAKGRPACSKDHL